VLFNLAYAQTALEYEVFRLTNEARMARGLHALSWDGVAYAAARKHALDMLNRGYFDHVNPEGLGPVERMWAEGVLEIMVGENLALYKGYSPEYAAGVVVEDWLGSPRHRDNLLKPEFTHLGIALVQVNGRVAVVQNFISRPFKISVTRTPSRKRIGIIKFKGRAPATVGIFIDDVFREELQPPSWSGELELDPGSAVSLAIWESNGYLLACRFSLPDTSCTSDKISWWANYSERTVPSVMVRLSLPEGAYWLGYGDKPHPLEPVRGVAVVDAPEEWKFLWVGIPKNNSIEFTHRIPIHAVKSGKMQKGAKP